jgi:hypothetical protein
VHVPRFHRNTASIIIDEKMWCVLISKIARENKRVERFSKERKDSEIFMMEVLIKIVKSWKNMSSVSLLNLENLKMSKILEIGTL